MEELRETLDAADDENVQRPALHKLALGYLMLLNLTTLPQVKTHVASPRP